MVRQALAVTPQIIETTGDICSRLTQPKLHLTAFIFGLFFHQMEDDLADFIGEIGYSSCSRYFFDFLNFASVSNIILIYCIG